MMVSVVTLSVWLLGIILGSILYQRVKALIAYRVAVRRYGCQQPAKYPVRDWLFGTDLYRERDEAIKRGKLQERYLAEFEKYGKTFEENVFRNRIINSMQPENIQQVATKAFEDYHKSGTRVSAMEPFLTDGITTSDGPHWRYARGLIKPIFSRIEISNLESLEVFFQRFLEWVPRDGSAFDIQPLLHKMFLDVSTEFIFGQSVDALLPESEFDAVGFSKAFNVALSGAGLRRKAGPMSFMYMYDKPWKRAIGTVHSFVDAQVAKALRETTLLTESTQNSGVDELYANANRKTILLYEMAKQIRDPIKLRYQVLSTFAPARDTTSILISNILFHLARNPAIWDELRRETLAIKEPLSFELLKSLITFRHVIFEAHRLQGPSGRMLRYAIRDTILPVGGGADLESPVFVAKGDTVSMNVWAMHHSKDIWGDDVHVFNPKRWKNRPPPKWEFLPFGGGPRICPAQQQALTHTTYVLVRLTQEFFAIENKDPVTEYIELVKMTTESRNGVKIALIPARIRSNPK